VTAQRDEVPPSWYPDPQRDGMLRWWDGTRWTEHVQPARTAGRPVVGQEVTGGIGPVTFFGPDEPVTHAFPPITDQRYAGSPLAEAVAQHVRSDRSGGDVQIPLDHQAAVEAAHQLRKVGGVVGAVAGVGEQLFVETMVARPGADIAAPGWMVGPGTGSTAPGMQSPAGRAGYRLLGRTVRGAAGALLLWRLLVAAGVGTVMFGIGLVLAVAVPGARPMGVLVMVVGVLAPALTWWSMSEPSERRGPW
jgi:hypothetical protein